MEDGWTRPSHTPKPTNLNKNQTMVTPEEMETAPTTPLREKLETTDSLMLHQTAHLNLLLLLTMDQSQLPLKPTRQLSNHIQVESSPALLVELHWTTVLSWLDMETKTDKNIGESETPGEPDGENLDLSELPRVQLLAQVSVDFNKLPHTQMFEGGLEFLFTDFII